MKLFYIMSFIILIFIGIVGVINIIKLNQKATEEFLNKRKEKRKRRKMK